MQSTLTQPPAPQATEGLPLGTARMAAIKVLRALRGPPAVITRAKVCGSVRREKDWCRDLDIVVCPTRAVSLFGDLTSFWSDDFLNRLAAGGVAPTKFPAPIAHRPQGPLWSVGGSLRPDSLQITLRSLKNTSFKVELWTTTPDCFGWMMMIRTGPRELGPALMRCARARGFDPKVQHCLKPKHGPSGLCTGYQPALMRTEHEVCEALGVKWRSPRGEERLMLAQEMHAIADAANIPTDHPPAPAPASAEETDQ